MRGFKYMLLILALLASANMNGQYNPSNPLEPGVYHTLTLESTPSDGGRFNVNVVSEYSEGSKINLRASANSKFKFVAWVSDGITVSLNASFTYTMPAKDAKLTAIFDYTPDNPSEPSEADLPEYSKINVVANPSEGGTFNVTSGNRYEVGSTVTLKATNNSKFVFQNWTKDGEVVSKSKSFAYVVSEEDASFVANFKYDPSNPEEPSEPLLHHALHLECNPSGGGYFNIASGNAYQTGTSVYLHAYSNAWYTFVNWSTTDGEVVSTNSGFNYTMPDENVKLVANYTYHYNPSGPDEPNETESQKVNIYGMTENGLRSQVLAFPIYMENPVPVNGMDVDVCFPSGFVVDTENIKLTGRALGHTMQVADLDNNTYRFSLSGNVDFNEKNGKLFEVPVTVPDTARTSYNYPVVLSHGVVRNSDGSATAVSVRSGYIYVNPIIEEGLYARFSYDKLLGRVQFMNLSSSKAVRYFWEFGDGTTSEEINPLHEYHNSGYYDVRLTVYGEFGEDVAEMTVLINDKNYWNVGGTFVLGNSTGGVRYFNAPDSLLRFVSSASVNENLTLMIEGGTSHTLDITEENTMMLQNLISSLSSNGFTFSLAKTGMDNMPTIEFGSTEDELLPEWVSLYNSFVPFSTSKDVQVKLCGITYNPSAVHNVKDQQVKSGEKTSEMDFLQISSDLDITWELTSEPDPEAVYGFLANGEGNLPSMLIDNVDKTNAILTYHIVVKNEDMVFCEFDKTITVLPGNAFISEQEWSALNALHDKLVVQGWNNPWDMSCGIEGASTLKGVTVERGHITALDLSNQGLSAEFPTEALHFPRLESLSFAKNNLSGDVAKKILQDMTVYTSQNPDFESRLERLDLSENKFIGNVGLLSALSAVFKNLEAINLSYNCMDDVSPYLSPTITDLDLKGQSVDKMLELECSVQGIPAMFSQLPKLFTYDHAQQSYKEKVGVRISNYPPNLSASVSQQYWAVDFGLSGEETQVFCLTDNVFKGNSGDILYVSYPYAAAEVEKSYCKTTYYFENGDGNFDGQVNVLDLQASILYIMENYLIRPYNFTAANLWDDEKINVQDIICLVNVLMNAETDSEQNANVRRKTHGDVVSSDASVYVQDGKLILETLRPVAALDLCLNGAKSLNVAEELERMGMTFVTKEQEGGLHLIAYAMNGACIPSGTSVIGAVDSDVAVIEYAMLADQEANAIPVAFSGISTGVDYISPSASEENAIYDLQGRKIQMIPHKGIYIKNGHKIIK